MPQAPARATRFIASTAVAIVLALATAGCNTTRNGVAASSGLNAQASVPPPSAPGAPRSDAEWRQAVDIWGDRYRKDPADIQAAIAYARALRATDQRAQAVAVLQQTSLRHPESMALLGAYGRALADAGQYKEALSVLAKAHTPDNPDWRILNAQGAVLDELGRHDEARKHYEAALKIVPGNAAVLSNLGLSYALTKDLKRAETSLRDASAKPDASPRVRQNLALVIGLQGRFAEAERIASADLPPPEAEANVRYLREMIAKQTAAKRPSRSLSLPNPDTGT
jgi:Flp pilus assembly protein TadD